MSQPYVGEIRMFAGNFAPAGWEFCSGQLVPISENDTLFNLIGTTYGGDGQETFALPDLRGRLPVHMGTGAGLTTRIIGESGGVESVTLTTQQIPVHSHSLMVSGSTGSVGNPTNAFFAKSSSNTPYTDDTSAGAPVTLSSSGVGTVSLAGGSQPHSNLQPSLCINFIISMFGIFPSQT